MRAGNVSLLVALMFVLHTVSYSNSQVRRAKNNELPANQKDYIVSRERYFTDESGNILMHVNVWGHVNSPGRHLVNDGIDLPTLLSITGGPKGGANLRKVRLFRELPDDNGRLAYAIDFGKFIKNGDRTGFVKVLPNDTYIIPEKAGFRVLRQVGTVNTLIGVINLYYQLLIYRERAR